MPPPGDGAERRRAARRCARAAYGKGESKAGQAQVPNVVGERRVYGKGEERGPGTPQGEGGGTLHL